MRKDGNEAIIEEVFSAAVQVLKRHSLLFCICHWLCCSFIENTNLLLKSYHVTNNTKKSLLYSLLLYLLIPSYKNNFLSTHCSSLAGMFWTIYAIFSTLPCNFHIFISCWFHILLIYTVQ